MTAALTALIAALTLASHVPIPAGDYQIGPCPGYLTSCTAWDYGHGPTTHFETLAEARRSFYHEAGHQFDALRLEPSGLRWVFALIEGRPWVTPGSEERFADAFAWCAEHRVVRSTPLQRRQTCDLIRKAAG